SVSKDVGAEGRRLPEQFSSCTDSRSTRCHRRVKPTAIRLRTSRQQVLDGSCLLKRLGRMRRHVFAPYSPMASLPGLTRQSSRRAKIRCLKPTILDRRVKPGDDSLGVDMTCASAEGGSGKHNENCSALARLAASERRSYFTAGPSGPIPKFLPPEVVSCTS